MSPLTLERLSPFVGGGSIVVTVANHGYLPLVDNWARHLRRLGVHHYVVFALDDALHRACVQRGTHSLRLPVETATSTRAEDYGAPGFNAIVRIKPALVLRLLELGLDVFLSDADVVWIRDPRPEIRAQGAYDVHIQYSAPHYAPVGRAIEAGRFCNTGFFLARSNPATRSLFTDVVRAIDAPPTEPPEGGLNPDDQYHFNRVVHARRKVVALAGDRPASPDRLSINVLDPLRFPVGRSYFDDHDTFARHDIHPTVVHANYRPTLSSKILALDSHGLWHRRSPLEGVTLGARRTMNHAMDAAREVARDRAPPALRSKLAWTERFVSALRGR